MNRKIRIVAISDTHSRHQQINVPDGDILIHAGDATMAGGVAEIAAFDKWLGTLPHPVKFFCAGNHDLLFERNPALARSLITNATYLQDELIETLGLRIYFSPWQPRFFDWAFNLDRGAAIRAKWDQIPWPLDVLVTHGPPMGILDLNDRGEHCGCEELRPAVERGRPRVHIFGHIHESYGTLDYDGVRYVNACICDESYRPVNPPVVIDLESTLIERLNDEKRPASDFEYLKPIPEPDPEPNYRWMEQHASEYGGQWVALDGDRLIAHGTDAAAVFAAADADGAYLPLVTYIPPADSPPFIGL